jgi:hypothetical protein
MRARAASARLGRRCLTFTPIWRGTLSASPTSLSREANKANKKRFSFMNLAADYEIVPANAHVYPIKQRYPNCRPFSNILLKNARRGKLGDRRSLLN